MKFKIWQPLLLCAASLAVAKSPVETYGLLGVKGNAVVDSNGTAVTLRGMSFCGHFDKGCQEYWVPSVMSYVMTDWHSSVFRAPVMYDNRTLSNGTTLRGYQADTTSAMIAIRRMIDAAINLGAYIIVDWHTEQIHQSEANTFFGTLAKTYGSTPNIIWEIYNEPNGPGWSGNNGIAAYADVVIQAIRKYSKNIVLVGNPSWDQQPDAAGTELDKYSNIAYTVHFYNDQTHWGTVSNARAKGHAVFASEWGMSDHTGGGSFQDVSSTGNIKTWLGNLDTWGVSSCNWELGNPLAGSGAGPGIETAAALALTAAKNPSTAVPWADSDLSSDGISIRGYLRSKNPAWIKADTSTKLIGPLKIISGKTAGLVYAVDTIEFSATFNNSVAWVLTETGRTSKAIMTTSQTGTSVSAQHIIGKRNPGTPVWKDETVDAVLKPLGATVSYTISNTTSGLVRVQQLHETQVRWEGSRLLLPDNMIGQGTSVQVRLRNPMGQVLWEKSATMGAGSIELSQTQPRIQGLLILEVNSSRTIVRSRLAPSF